MEKDPGQQRGEFVVMVAPADKPDHDRLDNEARRLLNILAEELPASQAASLAAKITGYAKRLFYSEVLRLKDIDK
jgi:16S rRNA (cytidine1402-2'-O)-methyltransferase